MVKFAKHLYKLQSEYSTTKKPMQQHLCMWTCVTRSASVLASNPAGSLLDAGLPVCAGNTYYMCVSVCWY